MFDGTEETFNLDTFPGPGLYLKKQFSVYKIQLECCSSRTFVAKKFFSYIVENMTESPSMDFWLLPSKLDRI